jgi:hypothetical protein
VSGKKRDVTKNTASIRAELDARHAEVHAEVRAELVAAAVSLGVTRRAFIYAMGTAYDMASDDIAEGFKGDREACLNLLVTHVQACFAGLADMPASPGAVVDSAWDVDDSERLED